MPARMAVSRSCLFLLTLATSTVPQTRATTLEDQLIAADKSVWNAIAGAHPRIDQLETTLAPDYLDIDSGTVNSRNDVFDYLKTLTDFSFEYTSAHAYVLSENNGYVIATLAYHSVENGKPTSGRVLTTTVWNKQHGQWKAHLHTEMPAKSN